MSLKSGTLWKQTPISRALTYLSGYPVKEHSLKVPFMGPRREMPRSLNPPFIFQSPRYTSPLPDSRFPSAVKGPLWREMSVSGAFLNISSRVPSKRAPILVGNQSVERTLYRPSEHGEKQTHLCPWTNSHSDSSVVHFPYHFLRKITWRLPPAMLRDIYFGAKFSKPVFLRCVYWPEKWKFW